MNHNKFFKFGVVALSIVLIACTGGSEAGCPELGDRNLNVVATTPMVGTRWPVERQSAVQKTLVEICRTW